MSTDRLHQLLNADPLEFATTFGEASCRVSEAPPAEGLPLWMEGWVTPARTGYLLGEGEFIYRGCLRRFHFSVLPLPGGDCRTLHASGTITRLRRLSQFNGTYLSEESAQAPNPGRPRKRLRNENGVVIHLMHPERFRPFNTPYGGFHIRL